MWTITCCGKQREILRQGQYEDRTRDQMVEQLLSKAKDCMVFAGLVRYKLTGRVYEMLARAAGEGGAY
jgi:nuclear pore complex protein Nup93